MEKEKSAHTEISDPEEGEIVQIIADGLVMNNFKTGEKQKIFLNEDTVLQELTFCEKGGSLSSERNIERKDIREGDRVIVFLKKEGKSKVAGILRKIVDVSKVGETTEKNKENPLVTKARALGLDYVELLSLVKGFKPLIFDKIKKDKKEDLAKIMKDIGVDYRFVDKESIKIDAANLLVDDTEFFIISKDPQRISEFEKVYFKEGGIDKFMNVGKLLGYPECCSCRYVERIQNKSKDIRVRDSYFQAVQDSEYFSPFCNSLFCFYGRGNEDVAQNLSLIWAKNDPFIFSGSGQMFFISHAPCSFDCKESIEYGKNVYEILKENNPEIAEEMIKIFSKPILFFNMFEFIVLDGEADKKRASYKGISPPFLLINESIFQKVKEGNSLVVFDDRIEISKDGKKIHVIPKKEKEDGFLIPFSNKSKI